MNQRFIGVCAIAALAVATASAQNKLTMSGKCSKADVTQSLPAGDHEGHTLTLSQGKCSANGDINGATGKEGTYTEQGDLTPTHLKNWGVYVESMDNGDKVFYSYQSSATMKDGALQTGTNKWQITGGTGKMKGIKGSGTCKLTGNKDGGLDYSCSGEYTAAASAPAKK